MKQIKKILVTGIVAALCLGCMMNVSAAKTDSLQLTFKNPPEDGGWVSVKELTGTVEAGDSVTVTVYNDSDNENFNCFLSAREPDKWATVSVSDTVFVAPGTSEEVTIDKLADNASYYLLEMRSMTDQQSIYLQVEKQADYTAKTNLMSDLISSGKCTCVAGTLPTGKPSTPTKVPAQTATAVPTPTVTPTATLTQALTEAPSPSPVQTATAAPKGQGIVGKKDSLATILLISGAVIVLAAAAVTVALLIKKRRSSAEEQQDK